jgi:hypothetical protein
MSALEELFQQVFKNLAGPAFLRLLFEGAALGAITACPAYIPAEMTALELPGRTLFFHPTMLYLPAWMSVFDLAAAIAEEKKNLTFNMGRNSSPSLFVAMYGLQCNAEQFSHLFLCFSQLLPECIKFFGIQFDLLIYESSCYRKDTTDVHL